MPDDNPSTNAKASAGRLTRWQAIGAAVVGLLILFGTAWALDWELTSGFWRGVGYFLLEIISHLGK
jgi:4-hydroxybenzoate polyprenyltransferase